MRITGIAIFAVLLATTAQAQVPADDKIVQALTAQGKRIETPGVVLWLENGVLDEEKARQFAAQLNRGITEIQGLIGRGLDTLHYQEDTIHVFVGSGVGISHVYGSYQHMKYDRPFLFLDADKVKAGDAPWLHEATHILAWKFGSHSLREGFASWVEAEVASRMGIPPSGLFGGGTTDIHSIARERIDGPGAAEVMPWIGRIGFADSSVTSPNRPRIRSSYYILSQSFVHYLIAELGMETFLRVYSSADPEQEIAAATRTSLAAMKKDWQTKLSKS